MRKQTPRRPPPKPVTPPRTLDRDALVTVRGGIEWTFPGNHIPDGE